MPAAVIAAAVAVLLLIAFGQLGASTSSARTEREVVTASDGVVQSTVTGTGSLQPVTQEDVDFQTSGTLDHVDVKEGDYVRKGTLLATLKDATAALTLKQAQATLSEARTTLSGDETTLAAEGSASNTSDAVLDAGDEAEDVSNTLTSSTTTGGEGTPQPTSTATTTTTPTTTTPTTTTPTTTTPTTTTPTTTNTSTTGTTTATTSTSGTGSARTGSTSSSGTSTGSSATGSSSTGSSSSQGSSTVTAATIDADKLQIVEDEEAVKEDRQALTQTRLRAPVSGTITSLDSIEPGDSVPSGSDSSTSGGTSSSSSTAASGSSSAAATSGATGSTTASSSSSTAFAQIDTLRHLSMTVSFTEADINKIKVGQAAVVTLDAISGLELAGKVTEVSSLGTTTDDVTSYDATITLDQYDSRIKPGMSASAEVVIRQGRGVTVPSAAVKGSGTLASVTEEVDGRQSSHQVIVGIRGDSRDLIVSGLSAGTELVETETLPAEGSGTSGTSTSSSTTGSGFSRRGSFGGGSGGFSGSPGAGGPP